MEKKPPGHSRPSVRCKASRQEKKEEIERGVRVVHTPQGRAVVKGRERRVIIVCAVNARLDLGFRRVRRQKGGMLTLDQNSHVDLIT